MRGRLHGHPHDLAGALDHGPALVVVAPLAGQLAGQDRRGDVPEHPLRGQPAGGRRAHCAGVVDQPDGEVGDPIGHTPTVPRHRAGSPPGCRRAGPVAPHPPGALVFMDISILDQSTEPQRCDHECGGRMGTRRIAVTVDGVRYTDDVEPRLLLVQYLRERLGKTGTVVGCDTSNCGACTVHLDGRSVKSCSVLAVQADGARGHDDRGPGDGRRAAPDAAGVPREPRAAVRVLHPGHDHAGRSTC